MTHKIWDVIIVGGGPAGRSAAVVLARCNRTVLIIDEGQQRNSRSQGIHAFITRDSMLPAEFLQASDEELLKYDVQFRHARVITARSLEDKGFQLTDNKRGHHVCRRILLATGVTDVIPDIPGMQELWGCSVFHCPFCDGWEAKHKSIGVYSNSTNGYGMALTLRRLTGTVTLFTDGARYLSPRQRADLAANRIAVISKRIERLEYEGFTLKQVILKHGEAIDCDVLFVNEGHTVNSDLLQQLNCDCTRKGAAVTNRKQQTNIAGVYVAGDASYDMHMVVVAAAEGTKAGVAIHNDLQKVDNVMD
ncbi:NAD(P)/FAD-dependent oxidoreductase [Polluticoccus soli]|uniref:NAD(P)/FAD-dependent oxidoreductase n=1 Tax=Polluticoccus soli TaxID=3034150 RepID=UPI0023E16F52|nr:NAD(P)/FAD-dependent oxidoreductase [Flavipsychrobacter sp. JY13-12]